MFKVALVLIFGLIVQNEAEHSFFQLPRNVLPKSYSLTIKPDIRNATFQGEVDIFLNVLEYTKNITLNSNTLEINELVLDQCSNATKFVLFPNEGLLVIWQNENITPGEHFLRIKFKGTLDHWSVGFYSRGPKDEFWDPNVGAFTKFSPINARLAFPCFDNPFFKATFNIRLIKPDESFTALSNMPQINSFKTPNGIVVDFQTSVPMSTYLVAFMFVKNNYSEVIYEDNGRKIPIRAFSQDEQKSQHEFVLDVAKKLLKFFTEFTNISYALPKLDLIEVVFKNVPAMENYGLITFAQNVLFTNLEYGEPDLQHLQSSSLTLAHEICHMWFGNLVTHAWYSHLWLTEGICKYLEHKAIDHIFPSWKIKDHYPYRKLSALYSSDGLNSDSSEVVRPVETIDDIYIQFYNVYSKGSVIMSMLENVIGEKNFQKGLRAYLEKFKFKSAETGDLIAVMQETSTNVKIDEFLKTWLYQKRYPLVTVKDNETSLVLTQRNIWKNSDAPSIFGYKWTIPIFVRTNITQTDSFFWFDQKMDQLIIAKQSNVKWVKINSKQIGFYLTKYTPEMYENLLLNFQDLPVQDRAHLIDETYNLFNLEELSCEYFFRFLNQSRNDFDSFSSIYVVRSTENVFHMLEKAHDDIDKLLLDFIIYLFENKYEKLGWEVKKSETWDDRLYRIALFDLFCDFKSKKCLEDIQKMNTLNGTIHSDIKGIHKKLVHFQKRKRSTYFDIIKTDNVEKCFTWMRKNIPQFLKNKNVTDSL